MSCCASLKTFREGKTRQKVVVLYYKYKTFVWEAHQNDSKHGMEKREEKEAPKQVSLLFFFFP